MISRSVPFFIHLSLCSRPSISMNYFFFSISSWRAFSSILLHRKLKTVEGHESLKFPTICGSEAYKYIFFFVNTKVNWHCFVMFCCLLLSHQLYLAIIYKTIWLMQIIRSTWKTLQRLTMRYEIAPHLLFVWKILPVIKLTFTPSENNKTLPHKKILSKGFVI